MTLKNLFFCAIASTLSYNLTYSCEQDYNNPLALYNKESANIKILNIIKTFILYKDITESSDYSFNINFTPYDESLGKKEFYCLDFLTISTLDSMDKTGLHNTIKIYGALNMEPNRHAAFSSALKDFNDFAKSNNITNGFLNEWFDTLLLSDNKNSNKLIDIDINILYKLEKSVNNIIESICGYNSLKNWVYMNELKNVIIADKLDNKPLNMDLLMETTTKEVILFGLSYVID